MTPTLPLWVLSPKRFTQGTTSLCVKTVDQGMSWRSYFSLYLFFSERLPTSTYCARSTALVSKPSTLCRLDRSTVVKVHRIGSHEAVGATINPFSDKVCKGGTIPEAPA